MKKFELLEHTADLKIKVYGKTLEDLFINSALAMAEQQSSIKDKQLEDWEEIEIESADKESLLIDWLNEILSRSDLNKKVYVDFKISELEDDEIEAKIRGFSVEEKKIDIKAATYHGLEIKKVDDIWQAIIIFDI